MAREYRRLSDGAIFSEEAWIQRGRPSGFIDASLPWPPPPVLPEPEVDILEPEIPLPPPAHEMSRDRLLVELGRALHHAFPDRADRLFDEIEDRFVDRIAIQNGHGYSGWLIERENGKWRVRATSDIYRCGAVQIFVSINAEEYRF